MRSPHLHGILSPAVFWKTTLIQEINVSRVVKTE
jgi:hypothetical protein